MKRFHIEWLLIAISFVVIVAGLVQLFHEEAYAIGACYNSCQCVNQSCPGGCGGYASTFPTKSCVVDFPHQCCYPYPQIISCGTWCCGSC